jgi:O-acetyl-ADP-ribose deacetylase (regulator of RNase III)
MSNKPNVEGRMLFLIRSAIFNCVSSKSVTPIAFPLSSTPIYKTPPSRLFRNATTSFSNLSFKSC